ncbi:DMT family transporter [Algihabitans albus]|uniref:DMT family transporter n=1 Tax=Algihabitans albus TaxID=2164067 RepID=UPI0013C2B4F1|nr:DMT family transporter [Algihabitans albus]
MIVSAVFTMALQDAVVKFVSADFPLWQIYTLRSFIAIPMLVAVVFLFGGATTLRPRALSWAMLRGGLLVAMYIAFYASLPFLDLSLVAAAYYTGPLFITLFAALLLGEHVGRREILAILLGFAGVLVILRPGTEAFSPAMLVPIAAAVFYALANILTRGKCLEESPLSLSLALNFCFILCGGGLTALLAVLQLSPKTVAVNPFLLGAWVPVAWSEWAVLGGLAVANVIIHLALAKAYQSAPPQTIAAFDYSYLVFAAIWGFLLFREIPDLATLLGMALIAGAGLLLVLLRDGSRSPARSGGLDRRTSEDA